MTGGPNCLLCGQAPPAVQLKHWGLGKARLVSTCEGRCSEMFQQQLNAVSAILGTRAGAELARIVGRYSPRAVAALRAAAAEWRAHGPGQQ